jgi:WD40 repeat protein
MSIAFSPDGTVLASGSADKTIRLWDVRKRQELASLKGHKESVQCVAFSSDGKTLASGSNDSTVKLWDVETRKEKARLPLGTSFVHDVTFSPDGKTLVTRTGFNGVIKFWDVVSGKEIGGLAGFKGIGHSVSFTADGDLLAAVGDDGALKFIKVETGKIVATVKAKGGSAPGVVASADGKLFAFAGQIWDTETKKALQPLKMPPDTSWGAFSPDGKLLATTTVVMESSPKRLAARSGVLGLWDATTGQGLASLKLSNQDHASHIFAVAFAPDSKMVAAATADFRIVLLEVSQLLGQDKKK